MRVVICGAGAIGASTAYFVSRRGVETIVVEATDVAAAASGKAGGFLARDWCAGTPLDALARRSFELHAALAREIAGDWGYRRMTAYSGFVAGDSDACRDNPSKRSWLSDGVVITSRIGSPDTTAIVHPFKFTAAMMQAAQKNGATLHRGRVTGIVRHGGDTTAHGVEVDGSVIEADAIVIAMGPWSLLAAEWTSLPAVFGQRSPSLVYDTGTDVPPNALFLDYRNQGDEAISVEVFPRADGSTHITAWSEVVPLPLNPAAVQPEPEEIGRLQEIAERYHPCSAPRELSPGRPAFVP